MSGLGSGLDLATLRQWVGREQVQQQVLVPFPAQALAGLLEREPVPRAGDALPLPWHWLYFLDTPRLGEIGADGHPKRGGFLPPVPLPRRMWAESRIASHRPLQLGRSASKTSTVRAVDLKEGRSGPLVFVRVEHRYAQDEVLCLVEDQHIVYREAPPGPQPLPPGQGAPDGAGWSYELVPDAPLLFRFSALTYNGHRIHYDAAYAREVEHYPGLVVHGPLLATWLLGGLQRAHPALAVNSFAFRALRPAFVGEPISFCGRRESGRVELWTRHADGSVGVRAEAEVA